MTTVNSESTSSTYSCSAPQLHFIPMGFPWGIDFGNANCVMAGSKRANLARVNSNNFCSILHPVARRGGIDTICNEASQRQTACMVSFVDRERFLGEGARNKAQTNVKASCGMPRALRSALSNSYFA